MDPAQCDETLLILYEEKLFFILGVARISYAKFGKNIMRVLLGGMIGAIVCYIVAGISSNAILVFLACILTGLFTSMLWPGSLIMMEENIPGLGVAAYALMAASGDLGASVAPQLLGIVVDKVAASSFAAEIGAKFSLAAEQVGLKADMLVTAVFPMLGVCVLLIAMKYFKKQNKN